YTNAGKTTLLNRLAGSQLTAADQLFVTLDPAARLVHPEGGRRFVLTDTVGFIRKLPHELVAAFRATLEELADADVLLHVVDASHPAIDDHMKAVDDLLVELGVADRPTVLVMNKIDRLDTDPSVLAARREAVALSAVDATGRHRAGPRRRNDVRSPPGDGPFGCLSPASFCPFCACPPPPPGGGAGRGWSPPPRPAPPCGGAGPPATGRTRARSARSSI